MIEPTTLDAPKFLFWITARIRKVNKTLTASTPSHGAFLRDFETPFFTQSLCQFILDNWITKTANALLKPIFWSFDENGYPRYPVIQNDLTGVTRAAFCWIRAPFCSYPELSKMIQMQQYAMQKGLLDNCG